MEALKENLEKEIDSNKVVNASVDEKLILEIKAENLNEKMFKDGQVEHSKEDHKSDFRNDPVETRLNLHCYKPFVINENLNSEEVIKVLTESEERRKKSPTDELIMCLHCEKCFPTRLFLKVHQLLHLKDDLYSCTICKKKFMQKSSLKAHLRWHAGALALRCDICGTRFSQKRLMRQHLRVPVTQNLYICEICKKRFSQKCTLKLHLRLHTGDKPYSCRICRQDFTSRNSLKCRVTIHWSETASRCAICKKCHLKVKDLNKPLKVLPPKVSSS